MFYNHCIVSFDRECFCCITQNIYNFVFESVFVCYVLLMICRGVLIFFMVRD